MQDRFIAHPPGTQNDDTYRQFVELQRVVNNLATAQEDVNNCCGNIDGGQADTNYGGIFCEIDGGNAAGYDD